MSTTRRETLGLILAGAGAAAFAPSAFGHMAQADPVFAAYQANRSSNPYAMGVCDAPAAGFNGEPVLVHGSAPAGLSGVLYRNGPGRFTRDDWRYRHWFDGDGMIQAWRLADGQLSHRGRFVETQKWQREESAGRFMAPAFGSMPPNDTGISGPHDMNTANTSVLMAGDDLLALWEGGSPWALDPETLATRSVRNFGGDLAGLPFSAHPKRDSDGRIWNFGQDAAGERLILWRLAPDGSLEDARLVDDVPGGMIHDFAITEHSLVFLVGGFWFERFRLPILDSFTADASRPMRVIAFDKSDYSRRRDWELPGGFLFHTGGAWERADGEIHLDCALSPDAAFAHDGARAIMRGERQPATERDSRLTRITLKDGGQYERHVFEGVFAEFPQTDPRRSGQERQFTWHVGWGLGDDQGPNRLVRRDLESGSADMFAYTPGTVIEEPLFIPAHDRAAEGEGWLVATALNLVEAASEFHVFDAMNLADGPVAIWRTPYAVPLGFHGTWRGL